MTELGKRKRIKLKSEHDAAPLAVPPTIGTPASRPSPHSISVVGLLHHSISVSVDPAHLLSSLADAAFAQERDKLRPSLRLAFARVGQRVEMAHVIDPVKLDCVSIASFIALFPRDFGFHVVALINVQYSSQMPPIPILLTMTTTVEQLKQQLLTAWKLRQTIASDKVYDVELYHDEARRRVVTSPMVSAPSCRGRRQVELRSSTLESLTPSLFLLALLPPSLNSTTAVAFDSSSASRDCLTIVTRHPFSWQRRWRPGGERTVSGTLRSS